jgi:hypothetical protein
LRDAAVPATARAASCIRVGTPGSELTTTISPVPYTDGTTSGVDLYVSAADYQRVEYSHTAPAQAQLGIPTRIVLLVAVNVVV